MLHADNAEIVRATAGIVIDNITDITKVFYPKMFANHPDLLNVFNAANQAIGEQPIAFASSIMAYAHHLLGDSDIDFDHVLSRIAHKHVALAIALCDYTTVGRNFMEVIAEVLGDAVTPDVARAWEEAYWLFAMNLTTVEARLYQQIDRTPSTLLRDHRITTIDEVGGNARTCTLQAVDDSPVPTTSRVSDVSLVPQLREDCSQPRQLHDLRRRRRRVADHGQARHWQGRAPGRRRLDLPVRARGRRHRAHQRTGGRHRGGQARSKATDHYFIRRDRHHAGGSYPPCRRTRTHARA